MPRILVVGDCMLDRYWSGKVERISPEGPVPIVKLDKTFDRLGGALNVALNLRSVGADVSVLGAKGADEAGAVVEAGLLNAGIEDLLVLDKGYSTIQKVRILSQGQQLLRLDSETPTPSATTRRVIERFYEIAGDFDGILFSDYNKGTLGDIAGLIAFARQQKKPIFVDPKGREFSRYRGSTFLTPNTKELCDALGEWRSDQEFNHKCQIFMTENEIMNLVVTQGADGMALFTNDGCHPPSRISAKAREVFDVTGAGDTVIAIIAMLTCFGFDPYTAVHASNAAAGLVVERTGAATITRAELTQILKDMGLGSYRGIVT